MKKILILLLILITTKFCYSQYEIRGVVIDGDKSNSKNLTFIKNANINIKGTTISVKTDDIGVFAMNIPTEYNNKTLEISKDNFKSAEYQLNFYTSINITIYHNKKASVFEYQYYKPIQNELTKIDNSTKNPFDLNQYVKQHQKETVVNKNIVTTINTKLASETNEKTGMPESNLHVEFKYEILKTKNEKQISDFSTGKYKLEFSEAACNALSVLKQTINKQLAVFLTNGSKVTIKITGSTDAEPVKNVIPYLDEYGEFNQEGCFVNNLWDKITINKANGISSNEQLAFLRTWAIRDFIINNIEQFSTTQNTFQHYAIVAKENGAQYRNISIEIIIHDVLKNNL